MAGHARPLLQVVKIVHVQHFELWLIKGKKMLNARKRQLRIAVHLSDMSDAGNICESGFQLWWQKADPEAMSGFLGCWIKIVP